MNGLVKYSVGKAKDEFTAVGSGVIKTNILNNDVGLLYK